MKKILILAAALVGLVVSSSNASAVGYANPFNVPQHQQGVFAKFFRPQPLPAFQAAPWYLYYPYNGHFQTPAPLYGDQMGGYGAPQMGGGNPYFPNK